MEYEIRNTSELRPKKARSLTARTCLHSLAAGACAACLLSALSTCSLYLQTTAVLQYLGCIHPSITRHFGSSTWPLITRYVGRPPACWRAFQLARVPSGCLPRLEPRLNATYIFSNLVCHDVVVATSSLKYCKTLVSCPMPHTIQYGIYTHIFLPLGSPTATCMHTSQKQHLNIVVCGHVSSGEHVFTSPPTHFLGAESVIEHRVCTILLYYGNGHT